jgi:thiamine pyrophosphate-dependent acetolactate synthase large subunit-like protein
VPERFDHDRRARSGLNVFEAIAERVATAGVRTGFGVVGSNNMDFLQHWHSGCGGRWYAAAREDGAVLMADAYSRAGGGLAMACVTSGPGITNMATALVEAARAHTPLLVVAGDVSTADTGGPHGLDLAAFAAATGVTLIRVDSSERAVVSTDEALACSSGERRPVILAVPFDVGNLAAPAASAPPDFPAPDPPPAPPGDAIRAAASLLAAAQRPIVLAGRGALEARETVAELAAKAGALLATTLGARGLYDGAAFSIGACGGYATTLNKHLARASDCVVAFGASLNQWTTDHGRAFPNAGLIRCDAAAPPPSPAVRVALEIHGDAGLTAAALAGALAGERTGFRTAAVRAEIAGYDPRSEFTDESDEDGLDMRTVVLELERVLPPDRTVTVDLGVFTSEAARWLKAASPRDFLFSVNFGSVGLALGHAIGAAVATGRLTVAVVGDGGFSMSLAELDIAVRHRLPLAVVVMNDAAYGAEYHHFVRQGWPTQLSEFARPDYAAIARGFGARGVTIRRLDQIAELVSLLAEGNGPIVADVKLRRGVLPRWYADLIGVHAD